MVEGRERGEEDNAIDVVKVWNPRVSLRSSSSDVVEPPFNSALVNREDMLRDADRFDSSPENIVIRWHISWGSYAI